MVKFLRIGWICLKRVVLISTIALMMLAFWLHGGERSLQFAKPWILSAVNRPDAPFVISSGAVTVDWTNAATLGKLRIREVTFAQRDGDVFARLPEVYATIDPIGFLPYRSLLHKVIIHSPHISATRNVEGDIELGLEDSPSKLPVSDVVAFLEEGADKTRVAPPKLPFHQLIIDNAAVTFTDIKSETTIESSPVELHVRRHYGTFEALATLPFTIDDGAAKIRINLMALPHEAHKLTVQVVTMPTRLACLFDACPDKVTTTGTVDGTLSVNIARDLSLHEFHAALLAPRATLTAPEFFPETLKFTDSNIVVDGDWSKQQIALTQSKLQMEDTTASLTASIHHEQDGWYAKGSGEASRLEVSKIYKYWPIFLAPDSRNWITSKLKSGYASKGTLKFDFTPEDINGKGVRDASVEATADAHEVGFEYLPGFPPVDKMDGIARFTGKTVRVEGGNGSMLSGTTISRAVLWCPQLDEPKNPMEVELTTHSPASDGAAILSLKHFPFAAGFGLNSKTISGQVETLMKLKFNAFSGNPADADPNVIHLDAVDYDIAAKLKDVKQDKLFGGYNVHAVNGELKASNIGINFDGTVSVGEAGTNAIKLSQPSGKSLSVSVKGVAANGKPAVTNNDFTLTYAGGSVPVISVTGNKLDASASYGSGTGTGVLANFPAMKLDVDLDTLYLIPESGFTHVDGHLSCSAQRCESAQFTANAGKSSIKAGINTNAGARQFLMTANDAGLMLKNLDLTDRMTGGAFELRGTYDDKKSPPQLNSRLLISNFKLQNSKVLGRIFAIGSLTGLQNALTGSGISFDRLSAGLASRAGLVTITKGVASGNSIGITVDGTLDTVSTRINFRGTLAPAYAINSILSKIPVIGWVAGGDQGLIAFNYSVRGSYSEPDVGVNPLSGLTPGFLRGIFGVFDSGDPKPQDGKPKSAKPTGTGTNNPNSGMNQR